MMRRLGLTLVVLAVVSATASAQRLSLGDPAPELKVSDWVKGGPVSIEKGKGKNAYVIEFWATWCPPCIESIPHLTELQRKYGNDGLVVVAISNPGKGETLKKVKRFVSQRGDSMGYTVAYDGANTTQNTYMGGVGAAGIPWAFVIDKQGRLAWYGHPGDPTMDVVIDEVIKGTYDPSDAIRQQKLAPMINRLNQYSQLQNWPAFKSTCQTILSEDPKNELALGAMVYVCRYELNDESGLRQFAEGHMRLNAGNGEVLNALALAILSIGDLDKRVPDLAMEVATAAYEACKGADCEAADTYARALYEIGLVDRAIELHAQAVGSAEGDRRAMLEKVAEYYKMCKALQSSPAAGG